MLKGLDTSAIKYAQCIVPAAVTAAASSQPVDFSNFTFGTVLATGGSIAGAITVNVVRSATSNGTFNGIGCSLNLNAASKTQVRSFTANSSAVWYKLYYTHTLGSPVCAMYLIAQGSRKAPIEQDTNTTSYSVISNA
jgi:hypothetical protein